MDSDFKHRSSRRCHIQHTDLSAASPSLLIALLRSLSGEQLPDCTGNRLQPTSKSTFLCPCNLPWGMHTYGFFSFVFFSQFSPYGTVFERWTLIIPLIVDQFTWWTEKTSYLDSIGAPRHALCPAMMSALPLLYRLLFLLYHKSDLSLLRVWWSFPFSLHLQHVSQLPQDFVKSSIISLLSQNY